MRVLLLKPRRLISLFGYSALWFLCFFLNETFIIPNEQRYHLLISEIFTFFLLFLHQNNSRVHVSSLGQGIIWTISKRKETTFHKNVLLEPNSLNLYPGFPFSHPYNVKLHDHLRIKGINEHKFCKTVPDI